MVIDTVRLLEPFATWLVPLSPENPCGENLEYDPLYMDLFIRLTPKEKKVVNGASGTVRLESEFEPVRWGEVERDCWQLLERTKDLRLVLVLLRCKVQQEHGHGLVSILALLLALLRQFPESLYPCLTNEGVYEPLERAAVLSALTEQDGLLSDIRRLSLASLPGLRLEVRDVERALAIPHPEDALTPEAMQRQLEDLAQREDAHYLLLLAAGHLVHELDDLFAQQLGADAPSLDLLMALLDRLKPHAHDGDIEALADSTSAGTDGHAYGQPLHGQVMHNEHASESGQSFDGIYDNQQSHQQVNLQDGQATFLQNGLPMEGDRLPGGYPLHRQISGSPSSTTARLHAPVEAVPRLLCARHISHRRMALEQIREVRLWFEEHEPSSPVSLLLRQGELAVGKRFAELAHILPQELLEKWENEK